MARKQPSSPPAFAGEGARARGFRRSYKNRWRAIGPPSRSCGDAGLRPRGLQRIALQSRRIVLQRADAGRFGLAAPLLQVAQGIAGVVRSEEHTSELQSLMRTSYAVFCWKKKNNH